MRTSMRELKAGLSRYIALARAGQVIEVSLRGKPVARIVGIPPAGVSGIDRLLATGAAQWTGGRPVLTPTVRLTRGGKSLSAMVLEDRG